MDLQSIPFDRSGIPPLKIANIALEARDRVLSHLFQESTGRASGGIRTHDRLITNQLLCQLSYAGLCSERTRSP